MYAYCDRRQKKHFRKWWITRITQLSHQYVSYSRLMHDLKVAGIETVKC